MSLMRVTLSKGDASTSAVLSSTKGSAHIALLSRALSPSKGDASRR